MGRYFELKERLRDTHPTGTFLGRVRHQAADAITALEADRDALKAENERLREALVFVRDTKPIFDYAAVRNGRADLEAPGSPYDRGKADAYRLFSKYARAALEQGEG